VAPYHRRWLHFTHLSSIRRTITIPSSIPQLPTGRFHSPTQQALLRFGRASNVGTPVLNHQPSGGSRDLDAHMKSGLCPTIKSGYGEGDISHRNALQDEIVKGLGFLPKVYHGIIWLTAMFNKNILARLPCFKVD
jgi:hypothetical protein